MSEKRPYHPRGPNATAKYTSRARREARAISLSVTEIGSSPEGFRTWMCNGHLVISLKCKAIRCSCPDFTQIDGFYFGRNWLGSAAGPFNPCKHMIAVDLRINAYVYWVQSIEFERRPSFLPPGAGTHYYGGNYYRPRLDGYYEYREVCGGFGRALYFIDKNNVASYVGCSNDGSNKVLSAEMITSCVPIYST